MTVFFSNLTGPSLILPYVVFYSIGFTLSVYTANWRGGRGRRRGEWRKGREGQEEATLGVMCRYIDEPTVCLYMG